MLNRKTLSKLTSGCSRRAAAVLLILSAASFGSVAYAQTIATIAGNGTPGFSGDGGAATSASLNFPNGVAIDSSGNVYIADIYNHRIRKVAPGGVISTIAGNGTAGFSGDGGAATSASLNRPVDVAIDSSGNVYIADVYNERIRKVAPGGVISTIAGNGTRGFSGDGGAAMSASLDSPAGVAIDSSGNVYIADQGNHRIRKVTPGGMISTIAGNGTPGFSGDGGAATSASLSFPARAAIDIGGNVYIADDWNHRIRKVAPSGVMSTIAGNGSRGFSGDGGAATSATLDRPVGVAVDSSGNVYIVDMNNYRIRKVAPGGGISTIAGNGTPGFSGDGGAATSASLDSTGVAIDSSGNVYIADFRNHRIRKVTDQNPPRLHNISTRLRVLTGDHVLIGGFIIGGSTPKTVVVRARGPSLTALGVPNALANPVLNLLSGQTIIASNDDFGTATNAAQLQASGFAPSNPLESAILVTLNPGAYTAIVMGAGLTTGVGMVEVFEVDALTTPLVNISTRGSVLTGDDVMIGGIVIQGSGPQTILVRARGPSLAAHGVPNVLANPLLGLYSGQTLIATNDNWQTATNAATIQSIGFAPSDPSESAILITLDPGPYTAIVGGAGGTTGIGLIEFFRVP